MMARIWCTNRLGLHPASASTRYESPLGISQPPYERLNLGLKVGDSKEQVWANRDSVRQATGIAEILYMDQVHSARMVQVRSHLSTNDDSSKAREDVAKCDGIFMLQEAALDGHGKQMNIGIAVQAADCVPLIITGESVIAAIHIGRDGLLAGMTESALDAILLHTSATSIHGVIGPSICGNCYPNSLEVFENVTSKYPATSYSQDERKIDVASGVISVLENRGITWSWFGGERECVSCDNQYFSYRRASSNGIGDTGRQAMIVAW